MGIFGRMKGRFKKGEEDDFDDIRDEVLGEKLRYEGDVQREPVAQFGREQRRVADRFATDVPEPTNPFAPARPERENLAFEQKESDSYEVLDRLKFIESQLSAIKSQTELINERLKILDTKMGRRY